MAEGDGVALEKGVLVDVGCGVVVAFGVAVGVALGRAVGCATAAVAADVAVGGGAVGVQATRLASTSAQIPRANLPCIASISTVAWCKPGSFSAFRGHSKKPTR